MKTLLFAVLAAAILVAGFSPSLSAQGATGTPDGETLRDGTGSAAEERRERFRSVREIAPAEEDRGRGGPRRGEGTTDAPPPENYLEQFEFRSILIMDGVTQFTLRNPYENRTVVLTRQEGRHGIEVVEFDSDSNALTLSHEGQTHTLTLRASRVAALSPDVERTEQGRQREEWDARRERFREFRATWDEAARTSPELREIDEQVRELGRDFRQTLSALREAEPDSPEHRALVKRQREMREDFRLLGEYSLMEVRKNPAFQEADVELLQGMQAFMMRGIISGPGTRGEGRSGR